MRILTPQIDANVEKDFSDCELRDFTIRKEIVFESKDKVEVSKKECELIVSLTANDPAVGYNQTQRKKAVK